MNRQTIRRFSLISALAMSMPLASLAQDGAANDGAAPCTQAQRMSMMGEHGRHQGAHGLRGGHGRHGVTQDMHRGQMMRALDLSEAQRDQMFALRHAQAPKMRELRKTMRTARRELRALAMSDSFDEGRARKLIESSTQASAEIAMLRTTTGNQMFRILTPEQREKLQKRAARHGAPGNEPAERS